MIEIDGSYGEGGGQILRTTLALSTVLGREVRIVKIRAGRPRPGLMAQHLTGVNATAALCDADVEGARMGSEELVFKPRKLKAGRFLFEVGTAGSVTLVLQALMPVLAFAPGRVNLEITGGTDVRWSPPVDYLPLVELPILEKYGYHGKLELVRRGHFPKGRGYIKFTSEPVRGFKTIKGLEPGRVTRTFGISHISGLPSHVAVRQAESAKKVIAGEGFPEPDMRTIGANPLSRDDIGTGIVVGAETENGALLGGDSLGDRGLPAEKVGMDAAFRLVEDLRTGAFFDRHMADIIVPYAALAEGKSEASVARVTGHVQTNVKVAEWIAGVSFILEGELDHPGRFRVDGLGLKP